MAKSNAESAAEQFVEKWSRTELSERAASHEHFMDLCRLIDQPTPASADATGEEYTFEKPVKVTLSASKGSKGEAGFVDVWKKGCFAWEYKRKDKYKNLDEAYRQLYQYRDALDNPPLSVVCDIRTTEIRTHFQGFPTTKIVVKLEEIPSRLEVFRRIFNNPDSFKPEKTTETVTLDLAREFGELADRMIDRYPPENIDLFQRAGDPVAHFLMKVMFCLFAEDISLLPDKTFTKIVRRSLQDPEKFQERAATLFAAMRTGGEYGSDDIPYFNGGLFDNKPPLPLKHGDLLILAKVADQDWSGVEPSIFGTLFERLLDPKKRAQIGAHYTSKSDILLVVEPVVMQPLRRKWDALKTDLQESIEKLDAEPDRKMRDFLAAPLRIRFDEFRRHLGAQRILDPACGSGNFLYVALRALLDLDDEVVRFAAVHDVALNPIPYVRPVHDSHAQVMGIEINRYAAELAQVVIWIGYLQWLSVRGIDPPHNPILNKLDCIDNRDAILDLSDKDNPQPAKWPEADFIIGNPPFLGASLLRQSFGHFYTEALFRTYEIPSTSDLCCYWFAQAHRELKRNVTARTGLLATQGIRGPQSRAVLQQIVETGQIFEAWSDRDWTLEGAAVHVSIIAFDAGVEPARKLDGDLVKIVHADLTAASNITTAKTLIENRGVGYFGDTKKGQFDIDWIVARRLLSEGGNPSGIPNTGVVKPWMNGIDVNARPRAMWIVDFGGEMPEAAASQFAAPFEYVRKHVKPARDAVRNKLERSRWWLHARPAIDFRESVDRLPRYLGTCRVAKHRIFSFLSPEVIPDGQIIAFARADDYFLGVLQSSAHELWSLETGTQLEDRPRYRVSSCFETFPLPWPPGNEDVKHPAYVRIATAAKDLNENRERWLNPPEWIEQVASKVDASDKFEDVPEAARGLIRQSAIMAAATKDSRLKKRTLTNLYNERPTWLKLAHETLDRAVLAAYAAVDPEGDWKEDWANVWMDTGAGQKLPQGHPLIAERARVDQFVLGNLLRMNGERAGPKGVRE